MSSYLYWIDGTFRIFELIPIEKYDIYDKLSHVNKCISVNECTGDIQN